MKQALLETSMASRRVTTLVTDEQWVLLKDRALHDAVTMSDQLRALITLYADDSSIRERADEIATTLAVENRRRRYGGTT